MYILYPAIISTTIIVVFVVIVVVVVIIIIIIVTIIIITITGEAVGFFLLKEFSSDVLLHLCLS